MTKDAKQELLKFLRQAGDTCEKIDQRFRGQQHIDLMQEVTDLQEAVVALTNTIGLLTTVASILVAEAKGEAS